MSLDNIQVRGNFEYLKIMTPNFQQTDFKNCFVKVICFNFNEINTDIILYQYEILFGNLRNIREDYRNSRVWWPHAFLQ